MNYGIGLGIDLLATRERKYEYTVCACGCGTTIRMRAHRKYAKGCAPRTKRERELARRGEYRNAPLRNVTNRSDL